MEEKYQLTKIRKEIFLTAYHGNSSAAHLASAYSVVEILYTLYCKGILNYKASEPQWRDRDRLILSKGHASLALYSILAQVGFFDREILKTFCFPDSFLGGEPNMLEVPGVEATTGALGHGLSYGIGIALGLKMNQNCAKVYVVIGDGECQEGSIWEGIMSAYRYQLDNLIVIMDCNKMQKMDSVQNIMQIDEWQKKWASFGWAVDIVDGHNVKELQQCMQKKMVKGIPRLIIANTVKGYGVSIMENHADWHYKMPRKKELKVFMAELGISQEDLS
ncbi:MAG: transketolase [Lachnospiraceae bacterium]|jgi:transketolase|nr:transketolase [Lachnospiraceae bacterium]